MSVLDSIVSTTLWTLEARRERRHRLSHDIEIRPKEPKHSQWGVRPIKFDPHERLRIRAKATFFSLVLGVVLTLVWWIARFPWSILPITFVISLWIFVYGLNVGGDLRLKVASGVDQSQPLGSTKFRLIVVYGLVGVVFVLALLALFVAVYDVPLRTSILGISTVETEVVLYILVFFSIFVYIANLFIIRTFENAGRVRGGRFVALGMAIQSGVIATSIFILTLAYACVLFRRSADRLTVSSSWAPNSPTDWMRIFLAIFVGALPWWQMCLTLWAKWRFSRRDRERDQPDYPFRIAFARLDASGERLTSVTRKEIQTDGSTEGARKSIDQSDKPLVLEILSNIENMLGATGRDIEISAFNPGEADSDNDVLRQLRAVSIQPPPGKMSRSLGFAPVGWTIKDTDWGWKTLPNMFVLLSMIVVFALEAASQLQMAVCIALGAALGLLGILLIGAVHAAEILYLRKNFGVYVISGSFDLDEDRDDFSKQRRPYLDGSGSRQSQAKNSQADGPLQAVQLCVTTILEGAAGVYMSNTCSPADNRLFELFEGVATVRERNRQARLIIEPWDAVVG